MIKFYLKNLKIQGFRGLEFEENFDGRSCSILSPNKWGKSRVMDAFFWCILNIDSKGRKNFDLFDNTKERDAKTDKPISVETVISKDNITYKFKRTASVGWTRARGTETYVRKGSDSYKFFIDDVVVSASKYKEGISEIFGLDYDILQVIMNNSYIFTLEEDEQKKILEKITSQASLPDLSSSFKELLPLLEKFKGDIDAIKKHLKEEKNYIKERIDNLPGEISGIQSTLGEEINTSSVDVEIAKAKKEIQKLDNKVNTFIEDNKGITNLASKQLKELSQKKIKARSRKDKYDRSFEEKKEKVKNEISKLEEKISKALISNEISVKRKQSLRIDISKLKNSRNEYQKGKEELLKKYHEYENKVFDGKCPFCTSTVPEEKRPSFEKTFEENKNEKLQEIKRNGTSQNSYISKYENDIKEKEKELNEIKLIKTETYKEEIKKLQDEYTNMENKFIPYIKTEQCKLDSTDILNFENSIVKAPKLDTSEIDKDKKALLDKITNLSGVYSLKKKRDQSLKKIIGLQEELKANNGTIANYEKLIFSVKQYGRDRVMQVSNYVNSLFSIVDVQVLEEKKDGTLADCCKFTINGSGPGVMSNAERTSAGIDVSETLMKFFDVSVPLFIDDAEKYTNKIEFNNDAQHILLIAKGQRFKVDFE